MLLTEVGPMAMVVEQPPMALLVYMACYALMLVVLSLLAPSNTFRANRMSWLCL